MSVAYIPSPARGVWHLGPVPIRAYALCLVLGVIAAVWVANRRYLAAGGRPGLMLDVAAWAVPLGLAGARLYSVATDYQLYFGRHGDWLALLKVWDGGLGMPGGLAAGFAGAWIACRRAHVPLGPVVSAAAPGVALGQAIGCWSNWFNQQLYGWPASLPWALQIDPAHRITGYETFSTFQPVFLYQSVWDLLVAVEVVWAAHRFRLAGARTFAVYLAAYAAGMFLTETVRIDYAHHIAGLRVNEWVAILAFAGAAWYLYRTRPPRPAQPPVRTNLPGVRNAPLPPSLPEPPARRAAD